MRPNPTEHPQIHSVARVARHRRLDCRYYSRCVDVAARSGWPWFTCAACLVRDELPRELVPLRLVATAEVA